MASIDHGHGVFIGNMLYYKDVSQEKFLIEFSSPRACSQALGGIKEERVGIKKSNLK